MSEPKCPDCGVVAIDDPTPPDSTEKSKDGKPWFNVVFCDECGHVYGVLAKHIFGSRGGPQLAVKERG